MSSWLSISTVINSMSMGLWEAAGCLGSGHLDTWHWALVTAAVLSFPEMLASFPRRQRRGHSPLSHVTPLQPTSHSQEPSPSIPLLHFPWTHAHTVGRDGREPVFRMHRNSEFAYFSSVPKYRDWNCVLMGNIGEKAVLKKIIHAGCHSKPTKSQCRRRCL